MIQEDDIHFALNKMIDKVQNNITTTQNNLKCKQNTIIVSGPCHNIAVRQDCESLHTFLPKTDVGTYLDNNADINHKNFIIDTIKHASTESEEKFPFIHFGNDISKNTTNNTVGIINDINENIVQSVTAGGSLENVLTCDNVEGGGNVYFDQKIIANSLVDSMLTKVVNQDNVNTFNMNIDQSSEVDKITQEDNKEKDNKLIRILFIWLFIILICLFSLFAIQDRLKVALFAGIMTLIMSAWAYHTYTSKPKIDSTKLYNSLRYNEGPSDCSVLTSEDDCKAQLCTWDPTKDPKCSCVAPDDYPEACATQCYLQKTEDDCTSNYCKWNDGKCTP